MDLQATLNKALQGAFESEELKEKITKQVESQIHEEIIRSLKWGPISEQIKKFIEEKIELDFGLIDISTYNEILSRRFIEMVKESIDEEIIGTLQKKLTDQFTSIELKEEYTLDEFLLLLVNHERVGGSDIEFDGEAYYLNASVYYEDGTYPELAFSPSPGKPKHRCPYRIIFSKDSKDSDTYRILSIYGGVSLDSRYYQPTPLLLRFQAKECKVRLEGDALDGNGNHQIDVTDIAEGKDWECGC